MVESLVKKRRRKQKQESKLTKAIYKAFQRPKEYLKELEGRKKKIDEALKSEDVTRKKEKGLKEAKEKIENLEKMIKKDIKERER